MKQRRNSDLEDMTVELIQTAGKGIKRIFKS